MLHVITSRLGETSSGAGRGSERNYSELGGLAGGGKLPTLPAMPTTGMMASGSVPPPQPLLVVWGGRDSRQGRAHRVGCLNAMPDGRV